MKKIIDGKIYNTETAEEIGSFHNALSHSDFRHLEESLYKTKKGAYFVHGYGGAMTRWAESNGDCQYGSSGIEVLTTQEAREWCEQHEIDADVIISHFETEEG